MPGLLLRGDHRSAARRHQELRRDPGHPAGPGRRAGPAGGRDAGPRAADRGAPPPPRPGRAQDPGPGPVPGAAGGGLGGHRAGRGRAAGRPAAGGAGRPVGLGAVRRVSRGLRRWPTSPCRWCCWPSRSRSRWPTSSPPDPVGTRPGSGPRPSCAPSRRPDGNGLAEAARRHPAEVAGAGGPGAAAGPGRRRGADRGGRRPPHRHRLPPPAATGPTPPRSTSRPYSNGPTPGYFAAVARLPQVAAMSTAIQYYMVLPSAPGRARYAGASPLQSRPHAGCRPPTGSRSCRVSCSTPERPGRP